MQALQLRIVTIGGAFALAVACESGSVSRAHHGADLSPDLSTDALCDASVDAPGSVHDSGTGSNPGSGSGSGSSCGGSGSGSSTGSGGGSSINYCDDGPGACGSNAQCLSCLNDAQCAEGPDPVWTGTECVCADTPEHCQLKFCCSTTTEWNPTACACIPLP